MKFEELNIDVTKEYYTTKEVAELTGIGFSTINKMINRNEIKAVKVGKIYAISESEVERLIDEYVIDTTKYFTTKEASEVLNLPTYYLSNMHKSGRLKGKVFKAKLYFPKEEIYKMKVNGVFKQKNAYFTKHNYEIITLFEKVRAWAEERGIDKAEPAKQMLKVCEELGETAGAMARGERDDLVDSLGDLLVTIIILAQQNNLKLEDCLAVAYKEIANRKGKTVNGVFVKESDLKEGNENGLK